MVDYTTASGYVTDELGRRQHVDRNDAEGVQGTYLVAKDRNQDRNTLVGTVKASGQTPDAENDDQLTNAILGLGAMPLWSLTVAKAIGGYGLGSVVRDTAGALWRSEIAANTTQPGADGAEWVNLFDGLASEDWADGRYLQNYATGTDEAIKRIAFRPSAGAPFIDGFSDGPFFFQRQGDYATNTALDAEATRATTVESNLTTRVATEEGVRAAAVTALQNAKANVDGGNNLSGNQNISKGNVTLVGDTEMGAASYQNIIQRGDAWRFATDYLHDDDNGNYSRQIFYNGATNEVLDILYYFLDRGRMSSAMHGDYALVSDFGVSLASNGYQKLPGGLIVQWGVISSSNGTFNFPITFPNGCFFVLPGNTNAQGSSVDNAYAYPLNASEFFAATKESQGSNAISGFAMAWIAFGY